MVTGVGEVVLVQQPPDLGQCPGDGFRARECSRGQIQHGFGGPVVEGGESALPGFCSEARMADVCPGATHGPQTPAVLERDRKSTRLNSSHVAISYAVFCLKKKKS